MITPTEDDASPETRFVRRVESGSVPLPSANWVRSTKLKDYALCFDQESKHCGWLMLEGWDNNWVQVRRLTLEELVELRDDHRDALNAKHVNTVNAILEVAQRAMEKERNRGR